MSTLPYQPQPMRPTRRGLSWAYAAAATAAPAAVVRKLRRFIWVSLLPDSERAAVALLGVEGGGAWVGGFGHTGSQGVAFQFVDAELRSTACYVSVVDPVGGVRTVDGELDVKHSLRAHHHLGLAGGSDASAPREHGSRHRHAIHHELL